MIVTVMLSQARPRCPLDPLVLMRMTTVYCLLLIDACMVISVVSQIEDVL
jgi:hypothetical protein